MIIFTSQRFLKLNELIVSTWVRSQCWQCLVFFIDRASDYLWMCLSVQNIYSILQLIPSLSPFMCTYYVTGTLRRAQQASCHFILTRSDSLLLTRKILSRTDSITCPSSHSSVVAKPYLMWRFNGPFNFQTPAIKPVSIKVHWSCLVLLDRHFTPLCAFGSVQTQRVWCLGVQGRDNSHSLFCYLCLFLTVITVLSCLRIFGNIFFLSIIKTTTNILTGFWFFF